MCEQVVLNVGKSSQQPDPPLQYYEDLEQFPGEFAGLLAYAKTASSSGDDDDDDDAGDGAGERGPAPTPEPTKSPLPMPTPEPTWR